MAHVQEPDFIFGLGTSPFKSARGFSWFDYWQPRCAYQR